jgi:AcrR family transcriptional regulator
MAISTQRSRARNEGRRRYESPRRAQHAAETRAAILDAAGRLFAEQGWTGTGMRDVARAAGVSVETVYSNFRSKADLLLAALDVAVVGDDLPIPVAERPEFTDLGRGSRAERARAAARLVREINERTYGMQRALREGAAGNSESGLAERLTEGEERRRVNVGQGLQLVAGSPVSDTERDGIWAVLSMDVYRLLVDQSGWSAARYEEWLAEAIVNLIGSGKRRP